MQIPHSKDNADDYFTAKFIDKLRADQVDFEMSSRPFFLLSINAPNYIERTKMQKIVKEIPRADARWLGDLLGQLSAVQVADAFRAAGYSQEQITLYTAKVRERIAALKGL